MRLFLTFALLAAVLALAMALPAVSNVATIQKANTHVIQDGVGNTADTLLGITKVQGSLSAVGDVVDAGSVVSTVVKTLSG